jgi:excisionase family DNA binding protein
MSARSRPHPAAKLLAEAGPTVSLAEAASVLGISLNTAYAAVKRGDLGVRALRYGSRWRIPTADLRRVVGLEDYAE